MLEKKRNIYGDPLISLYSMLNNLRLKYVKEGKDNEISIVLNNFGIKIAIDAKIDYTNDSTYEVFHYKTTWNIEEQRIFGESLMYCLIDRGYMAFIREHPDGGRGRIYRSLLIEHGWGRRIIKRRLDDWKLRKDRGFLCKRTNEITNAFSIHELIDRFPGFFDFLS